MKIQSPTFKKVGGFLGRTRNDTNRGPYKLTFVSFIFTLIFVAAGCNQQANFHPTTTPQSPSADYNHLLQVGSQTLNVQIASTPAEQEQGLSDRISMADNQGMLFDFNPPSMPGFWMKDMNFNLDFIWIANGKIIAITPNVPAPVKDQGLKINDSNLPVYYPPSPVSEELEVNAGWAKKNNIAVGDNVVLK